MICIDSSVWIAAQRKRDAELSARLDALLAKGQVIVPAVVRIELLAGATTVYRRRLRHDLGGLRSWAPKGGTWKHMEGWVEMAADRGLWFSMSDLLVAAAGAELDAPVWSLDQAFARMAKLGWITLYPSAAKA